MYSWFLFVRCKAVFWVKVFLKQPIFFLAVKCALWVFHFYKLKSDISDGSKPFLYPLLHCFFNKSILHYGSLDWSSCDYYFILCNLCFSQTQVHNLKHLLFFLRRNWDHGGLRVWHVGKISLRLGGFQVIFLFIHVIWLICGFTWYETKLMCLAFRIL